MIDDPDTHPCPFPGCPVYVCDDPECGCRGAHDEHTVTLDLGPAEQPQK